MPLVDEDRNELVLLHTVCTVVDEDRETRRAPLVDEEEIGGSHQWMY